MQKWFLFFPAHCRCLCCCSFRTQHRRDPLAHKLIQFTKNETEWRRINKLKINLQSVCVCAPSVLLFSTFARTENAHRTSPPFTIHNSHSNFISVLNCISFYFSSFLCQLECLLFSFTSQAALTLATKATERSERESSTSTFASEIISFVYLLCTQHSNDSTKIIIWILAMKKARTNTGELNNFQKHAPTTRWIVSRESTKSARIRVKCNIALCECECVCECGLNARSMCIVWKNASHITM